MIALFIKSGDLWGQSRGAVIQTDRHIMMVTVMSQDQPAHWSFSSADSVLCSQCCSQCSSVGSPADGAWEHTAHIWPVWVLNLSFFSIDQCLFLTEKKLVRLIQWEFKSLRYWPGPAEGGPSPKVPENNWWNAMPLPCPPLISWQANSLVSFSWHHVALSLPLPALPWSNFC